MVYRFRMEPTELQALELERTASVARYIYNWGLGGTAKFFSGEQVLSVDQAVFRMWL
ncbi:MAG TPA: helix-turn-helix domain-containing protein [Bryobacteraceae bacterium]|nr:helix-turn-helix domain-containing protein [Bryobacteraceae bacterium]